MKGLDKRKYHAVTFEDEEVYPWIVNSEALERITLNAAYISNLRKVFSRPQMTSFVYSICDHENDSLPNLSLDEVLKLYGIKSRVEQIGGFQSYDDYFKFRDSTKLALLTEKFYGQPYISLGSSRHCLLKDAHLKGVGFNALAITDDFHHRWGGFIARDALKSILTDIIVQKRTKLGSAPILANFIYRNQTLGTIKQCLQLRDASSFRLAQVHPDFCSLNEKKLVKDYLFKNFKTQNLQEILTKIIEHYIHSFSVGIYYRSPSFDNLLVDGRFIDCESIDFTLDKRPVPRFVMVAVKGRLDDETIKDLNFSDATHFFSELSFIDSSLHYLWKLCALTHFVFDSLTPSFDYDLGNVFENMAGALLKDVLKEEDWNLFKAYKSNTLMRLIDNEDDGQVLIKNDDLKGFSHFNYNHHFYDLRLNHTIVCFSENLKADLKYECNELLKKWEIAFWPKDTGSDWNLAFDHYYKMFNSI